MKPSPLSRLLTPVETSPLVLARPAKEMMQIPKRVERVRTTRLLVSVSFLLFFWRGGGGAGAGGRLLVYT